MYQMCAIVLLTARDRGDTLAVFIPPLGAGRAVLRIEPQSTGVRRARGSVLAL